MSSIAIIDSIVLNLKEVTFNLFFLILMYAWSNYPFILTIETKGAQK
jgi:hypothetical protein